MHGHGRMMAGRGGPLPHLPRRGAESGCRPRFGAAPGRGRRRLRAAVRSHLLRAAGVEQRVRRRRPPGRPPHAPRPRRCRRGRRPGRLVRRDDAPPLAPPLPRRARPGAAPSACPPATFELSQYLVDELRVAAAREPAGREPRSAYHDSCHMLRELRLARPAADAARRPGATCTSCRGADRCCGFGGTFSIRYPDVSTAMADDKLASAATISAATVASADPGCVMQIEGRASRVGAGVRVVHLATVLARGSVSGFEARRPQRWPIRASARTCPGSRSVPPTDRVRGLEGVDIEALRTAGRGGPIPGDRRPPGAPRRAPGESSRRPGAVVHRAGDGAEAPPAT